MLPELSSDLFSITALALSHRCLCLPLTNNATCDYFYETNVFHRTDQFVVNRVVNVSHPVKLGLTQPCGTLVFLSPYLYIDCINFSVDDYKLPPLKLPQLFILNKARQTTIRKSYCLWAPLRFSAKSALTCGTVTLKPAENFNFPSPEVKLFMSHVKCMLTPREK